MHIPVLLDEVIRYLNPRPDENFIDCTIGEAGHSLIILEKIKPNGKVLGIDADSESLKRIGAKERLILATGNFKDLKRIVAENNFNKVNGILFDLGLSSWQIEESGRGFSFSKNEPLDMSFHHGAQTAEEIVNKLPEKELINIFREYGEERFSYKIVKAIIAERKTRQIRTTLQLKEIIERSVPFYRTRRGQIERVLARIFQALRIAVNNELANLDNGLKSALKILEPGGRMVIISFHSLEDRITKRFFKEQERNNIVKILTKKPIIARDEEIKSNPRSRSAKLRAIIKI